MISFDLNHCSNELLEIMAKESRSAENLKQLLEFNEVLLAETIAENRYADERTLKYLYDKYKERVDYSLAGNSSTPQEILHELAAECSCVMAGLLLENHSVCSEDIEKIAERHIDVYRHAAMIVDHPNTSASTLIKVAGKHDGLIRSVLETGKVKLTES